MLNVEPVGPDIESQLSEAKKYILGDSSSGVNDLVSTDIGGLPLVKLSKEFSRATTFKRMLADYAVRKEVSRPICLAVFGPPGSGKSTIIKSIIKDLKASYKAVPEINLSQLISSADLSRYLAPVVGILASQKIPVIFFDEFDSTQGDRPLGWLKTFLGMMQDGLFNIGGDVTEIRKALLVFAGGTAETMLQFQERAVADADSYRKNKVPDFISRLHGFLDVQGLNGEDSDRINRRALALKFQLGKRDMNSPIAIEDGLLRNLLWTAHFIHHNRSLQAIVDSSELTDKTTFDVSCLPGSTSSAPNGGGLDQQDLLRLHISRGPLDGKLIGISTNPWDKGSLPILTELSRRLFVNGSSVAYGGDLDYKGAMQGLLAGARRVPEGLVRRAQDTFPIKNYLGFPAFLMPDISDQLTKLEKEDPNIVKVLRLQTLSKEEMTYLGISDGYFRARPDKGGKEAYDHRKHIAWSLSLFRMRLRIIQDVDALVVLGGKTLESWGRCSGIAEEVMIAQCLRKPVYILGATSEQYEASMQVGTVLGLGETFQYPPQMNIEQRADKDSSEQTEFNAELKRTFANSLAIPGYQNRIVTQEDVMASLATYFVGGRRWVDNGLTVTENRKLFGLKLDSENAHNEASDLILRGISRL